MIIRYKDQNEPAVVIGVYSTSDENDATATFKIIDEKTAMFIRSVTGKTSPDQLAKRLDLHDKHFKSEVSYQSFCFTMGNWIPTANGGFGDFKDYIRQCWKLPTKTKVISPAHVMSENQLELITVSRNEMNYMDMYFDQHEYQYQAEMFESQNPYREEAILMIDILLFVIIFAGIYTFYGGLLCGYYCYFVRKGTKKDENIHTDCHDIV